MTYEPLVDFEDEYEICIEYPYHIRRIGSDKDISFNTYTSNGYIRVKLNRQPYLLHRLVAQQFVENHYPEHLTEVDHINHDRTDNHSSNLRWVTSSDNNRNKTNNNGAEYTYFSYEDESDDLIVVTDYGSHSFEDYYSPDLTQFFFDTGEALRKLHINYDKRNGSAFVYTNDTDGKSASLNLSKFKKVYGLE